MKNNTVIALTKNYAFDDKSLGLNFVVVINVKLQILSHKMRESWNNYVIWWLSEISKSPGYQSSVKKC